MKRIVYILLLLVLASCANNKETKKTVNHSFTVPQVPALITDVEQRMDYVTTHFWDNFFTNTEYPTDSSHILGVKDEEIEQAVGNYLTLLNEFPVDKAQVKIEALFTKLEKAQNSISDNTLLFLKFSDLVVKYLYDPNSPYRSEDLYLPFVKGLTKSSFTETEKRGAYKFEYEKCLMNPYGSLVPDFEFKDIKNHKYNLYGVEAEYLILFFSNPGCNACLEIIEQFGTRPYLETMIKNKNLAIVNIYIDDEMDKWRDYVSTYPTSWYNCYDSQKRIKDDDLYYVRAIPSLYLLSRDKRVIYKDAPVEKVLNFLDRIQN